MWFIYSFETLQQNKTTSASFQPLHLLRQMDILSPKSRTWVLLLSFQALTHLPPHASALGLGIPQPAGSCGGVTTKTLESSAPGFTKHTAAPHPTVSRSPALEDIADRPDSESRTPELLQSPLQSHIQTVSKLSITFSSISAIGHAWKKPLHSTTWILNQ